MDLACLGNRGSLKPAWALPGCRSREMSEVEALALPKSSPLEQPSLRRPVKLQVASPPCGHGLPRPTSPSWTDLQHSTHSPEEPRGKGYRLPAVCCPQSTLLEMLPKCLCISGHSVRDASSEHGSAFSSASFPVDIHPCRHSRHQDSQQPASANSTAGLHQQSKPFYSPGCCRANHTMTLLSDQAFDRQQQS